MYNVTITFNVNGQIISRNEKDITLLSDSIDLIKARFNFSPEWQGYTKTAIFKSDTRKPYSMILVDDECMVPPEAIKKSKYMSVSVFGVSGTQLITATEQIVPLTPSGYTDDSIVSPAPTENIYQQIVTLMQKQAVDAVRAETAEGQAELFAGQAEESKNVVEGAKAVVMELGQKVADDKSNVEQAVSDFEIARQNAVKEIKAAENAALENIGTGIDDTLTQSGKAADAKATGDKLDSLKGDLDDVKDNLGFLFSHTGQEASTQFIADYKIVAGHTYLFKNNSQSTSLIVSSKASDKTTTIETFSSTLAKNQEITFTATLDAPYLRVWTNSNIGSWSIIDLTGINARVEQLEKDSIRFNDNYDVVSEIYKNRTLNLFDGNVTNGKVISSSDGSLIDSEAYRTSDFIKVEADTVYTFYKFIIVGYYTDKKVFIKRDYCRENNVTPINCAYVRLSTDLTSTEQMVLKGSYETIYYEAYKKTIGKELIENERWKENTYFNHIPIGYYQANEQIFWNPTERSVNDIYGIYDELVSNYSDYVSKEVLGTDQSGLYEVYKYSFKPVYPTSPNNKKHLPKIVIFSGVHGLERWSTYAIAQLMKAICNDNGNNEILEYLRYNVEFIVVPLVNPWGYIESTRWNSRGVNINRNFDYNWSVSGDEAFTIDYEGTEPFSECETTYVKKILYENLDAVGVIDAHTHDTTSWNNVYWHNLSQKAKSYDDMTCVSKNNISSMTRKMKNAYNLVFDGFIGNVDYGNTACLTGYATCVCELNGVTGEATDKLPSESQSGSALTNRTNVEFYANLICNILRYFYTK